MLLSNIRENFNKAPMVGQAQSAPAAQQDVLKGDQQQVAIEQSRKAGEEVKELGQSENPEIRDYQESVDAVGDEERKNKKRKFSVTAGEKKEKAAEDFADNVAATSDEGHIIDIVI